MCRGQEEYQAIETTEQEWMSAQIQTLMHDMNAMKGSSTESGTEEASVPRPRQQQEEIARGIDAGGGFVPRYTKLDFPCYSGKKDPYLS